MPLVGLTRGYQSIVDEDCLPLAAGIRWIASRQGDRVYAVSITRQGSKITTTCLHRLILDAPPGSIVDHINGDGLDNRRSNLRFCTTAQNLCNKRMARNNTSGHKGVSWHKYMKKWSAQIGSDKKQHFLGYFADKRDAAKAYAEAAKRFHGEFACLQ